MEVEAPEAVVLTPTEIEHDSLPQAAGDMDRDLDDMDRDLADMDRDLDSLERHLDAATGARPRADPGPAVAGDAPVPPLEDMPLHELALQWAHSTNRQV